MTITSLHTHEEFDRERDFTVTREFTLNGQRLVPGDVFDKSQVTVRRLRQLYEQRSLRMGPASEAPQSPFAAMSVEELRDWLVRHGVVPRATWSDNRLRERAERVLRHNGVTQSA